MKFMNANYFETLDVPMNDELCVYEMIIIYETYIIYNV